MAYRTTPTVEARLADNRARIVDAALNCISEGGWAGVVIAQVADAAGVSVGAVYRYFPSKGELLAQAYSVQTRRETEFIARIAASELPPAEKLSAAIRGFAARAVKGRRLAYAMLGEPAAPVVEAARLEYHAAFVQIFGAIVQAGIDRGDFESATAEVSAACIVGAMREALIGPLSPAYAKLGLSESQLIDELSSFCLRAVLQAGREQPAARRGTGKQIKSAPAVTRRPVSKTTAIRRSPNDHRPDSLTTRKRPKP